MLVGLGGRCICVSVGVVVCVQCVLAGGPAPGSLKKRPVCLQLLVRYLKCLFLRYFGCCAISKV